MARRSRTRSEIKKFFTPAYNAFGSEGGSSGPVSVPLEYYYVITGEESGTVTAGNYEYAYGAGATSGSGEGPVVYVPSGWTAEAVAFTIFTDNSTSLTVELNLNGVDQGSNTQVTGTVGTGTAGEFPTPVSLSSGDVVCFKTAAEVGSGSVHNIGLWIKMTKTIEV